MNNVLSGSNSSKALNPHEIRSAFVEFQKKKKHVEIASVPLLAENDSTLLFVNSGMFPLVPYLLGETHPAGTRLVNYQRSFRTDDIEEIGDNRHTTMFEMLGNWSLGDYFKDEQLNNWYEFLVEVIGIDPNRLYQSVFGGNALVEQDDESIEILKNTYRKYGIAAELGPKTTGKGELGPNVEIDFSKYKIFPYVDKNWWQRGDAVGELGGPDSETFYDTGKTHDKKFGEFCHPNCDCGRFIEIGNSVFMQYVKAADGWKRLDKKNVDFGGGLERISMVASGQSNIFKTDLFKYAIDHLEKLTNDKYENNEKKFEIIADHTRASTFLIMDGGYPSNKDQGYFIRRLLRRSLLQFQLLQLEFSELNVIVKKIIDNMKSVYPKLETEESRILEIIDKEIKVFSNTLVKGFKLLEKNLEKSENNIITGDVIFELHATFGIPFELVKEFASEKGFIVDEEGYHNKTKEHKDISKIGSDKKFKSGMADSSEVTIKYHTATHLLHKALQIVLGENAKQKGSNITPERLRFDFGYEKKLTQEELEKIEEIVNKWITGGFYVQYVDETYENAVKGGATGLFSDKYGDLVRVYSVKNSNDEIISKEICTGPHLEDSKGLGRFKILKEEAVASGIRRIKAIVE